MLHLFFLQEVQTVLIPNYIEYQLIALGKRSHNKRWNYDFCIVVLIITRTCITFNWLIDLFNPLEALNKGPASVVWLHIQYLRHCRPATPPVLGFESLQFIEGVVNQKRSLGFNSYLVMNIFLIIMLCHCHSFCKYLRSYATAEMPLRHTKI